MFPGAHPSSICSYACLNVSLLSSSSSRTLTSYIPQTRRFKLFSHGGDTFGMGGGVETSRPVGAPAK
eukprot:865351-Pyramimonas_sp.AAC.1